MHFAIDETGHEPTTIVVELQGCDEIRAQLIVGHSASVDPPKTQGLVGAAASYAELLGDVKHGA